MDHHGTISGVVVTTIVTGITVPTVQPPAGKDSIKGRG